jgi:hypothetical protein
LKLRKLSSLSGSLIHPTQQEEEYITNILHGVRRSGISLKRRVAFDTQETVGLKFTNFEVHIIWT